mmetsp:Transcript_6476/g.10060  ORF Transcript_6476/g.10060 Transcript_6476/m.10060 type:complete len:191 (+) Transcript_6476:91-663(+)|eukprot:CAMPEP_0184646670 /NCGR_PEP_ID=MMETSP0308-20130426/3410_1 /TAXON_ID=38269 /ORGANISM="Gloeochaete witrockiana, Strain SAG 46.84" /LENGTH=190 /DNA_ID=CAMNT_0027076911 /DNA_START=67 /DNA_END=639 /DNA_ORIENTATION=-
MAAFTSVPVFSAAKPTGVVLNCGFGSPRSVVKSISPRQRARSQLASLRGESLRTKEVVFVATEPVAFSVEAAAIAIPGSRGSGGATVLEPPSIGTVDWDGAWQEELSRRKMKDKKYRVLLYNDDFNKREYVVRSLLSVISGLSVAEAVSIMQKAHTDGFAVCAVVHKEMAEMYCVGLQSCGLFSSIEPDE